MVGHDAHPRARATARSSARASPRSPLASPRSLLASSRSGGSEPVLSAQAVASTSTRDAARRREIMETPPKGESRGDAGSFDAPARPRTSITEVGGRLNPRGASFDAEGPFARRGVCYGFAPPPMKALATALAAVVTASAPRRLRRRASTAPWRPSWPAARVVERLLETRYGRFVQRIGRDMGAIARHPTTASTACRSTPSTRRARPLRFRADCADVPYVLRAYFAYRNRLPFVWTRRPPAAATTPATSSTRA